MMNYELDIYNKKMVIYDVDLVNRVNNAMESDRFNDGHTIPTRYLMVLFTILSIMSLVARH